MAAQPAIDLDQPSEQLTRAELTIQRIVDAWAHQPRGREFAQALVEYLRSRNNPHTLRSYAYAVLELFGWLQKEKRRIPTPLEVRRADAAAFEQWLRSRSHGLREYYLEHDPQRRLDLLIYQYVRGNPGASVDAIRSSLLNLYELTTYVPERGRVLRVDEASPLGLEHRLACLVERKTLARTPSIADIRSGRVDVGLPLEEARRVGLDVPVPHEVFQYTVPEDTRASGERASTIATRLSAISGFWDWMTRSGENDGREPLLRVNIWIDPLRTAQRQAPTHQKATRAAKTPGLTLFERLLATTYLRRYGRAAIVMAAAQMRPAAVAPPLPQPGAPPESFHDLRDRALLLLLGQMGLRASEVTGLTRRSVRGSPPILDFVGKGGRRRQVRIPPMTAVALEALRDKLIEMVPHQERYHGSDRARELLQADAPLVPAILYWGRNAGRGDRGIGRAGIAMMLRRRAEAAGIQPGTEEFQRVHPHGLRHLFAAVSLEAGTPLNVVQAMMGHASGAQTMVYTEVHRPEALIARGFEVDPEAAAAEAPQVLHEISEDVPEPVSAPRPAPPARPPRPALVAPSPAPAEPAPAEPAPAEPVRVEPRRAAVPTRLVPLVEPPLEPLVGLGEEPEFPPEMLEEARSEAERKLDEIYQSRWGEKGKTRQQLGSTAAAVEREVEELADVELARALGIEEFQVATAAGDNLLQHTYVGRQSGLVWWGGTSGKLPEDMPVMSPGQMGDCDPERQSALCLRLTELWASWMRGEGPGPTGAQALLGWIAEAVEVAVQVGAEVEARGGRWVAFDAPWEDTAITSDPRLVFREHSSDAIVDWFEAHGKVLRRAVGRGRRVLEEAFQAPGYYASVDPLAEMPQDERADALDWIAALTGQPLRDQRPKFGHGASRAQIGEVLQRMCLYDAQLALRAEAKVEAGRELSIAERHAIERAIEHAAQQVDRIVGIYDPGFSITSETEKRVRARKQGDDKRELRREFYLRLVRRIFGAEAAQDPAIRLSAMCGRTPLSSDYYRGLFRIDPVRETIVSEPRFAMQFARDTGAHSECVARRMVRDLWAIQAKHQAGKRQRVIERPEELVELVTTMASYRIPCPRDLERELQHRLGDFGPQPIYEAWAAARRAREIESRRVMEEDIAEELLAFEEEFGSEIAREFASGMFENPSRRRRAELLRYTERVARRLPSPVQLASAAVMR